MAMMPAAFAIGRLAAANCRLPTGLGAPSPTHAYVPPELWNATGQIESHRSIARETAENGQVMRAADHRIDRRFELRGRRAPTRAPWSCRG